MVWLQLLRIGDPLIYDWVEEYMINVAAVVSGAMVLPGASEAMAKRLLEHLQKGGHDISRWMIELTSIVPGIKHNHFREQGEKEWSLWSDLSDYALRPFRLQKRLGSPDHYRLYFAFVQPAGNLSDKEILEFVRLAQCEPERAIAEFVRLSTIKRPQGSVLSEVLMDRLASWEGKKLPANAIPAILAAMADGLDDAARVSEGNGFGVPSAWRTADRVLPTLVKALAPNQRPEALAHMFGSGKALGWLAEIMRDEIFGHGLYGGRSKPEDERLLSSGEFETMLSTMRGRFADTDCSVVLHSPHLGGLLFGWIQGGGAEDAKKWVNDRVATEHGLLDFLSRVRGWASSSGIGVYYPLRRKELKHFFNDVDAAYQRVLAIRDDPHAQPALKKLAKEIAVAFQQGDEERWSATGD
jgi:hypothetical protein